jgi:hypothetical protein
LYCTISTRSWLEMFVTLHSENDLSDAIHPGPPGILSDMSKNQAPSIFLNFCVSL